jgi:hypothetical protein
LAAKARGLSEKQPRETQPPLVDATVVGAPVAEVTIPVVVVAVYVVGVYGAGKIKGALNMSFCAPVAVLETISRGS